MKEIKENYHFLYEKVFSQLANWISYREYITEISNGWFKVIMKHNYSGNKMHVWSYFEKYYYLHD